MCGVHFLSFLFHFVHVKFKTPDFFEKNKIINHRPLAVVAAAEVVVALQLASCLNHLSLRFVVAAVATSLHNLKRFVSFFF